MTSFPPPCHRPLQKPGRLLRLSREFPGPVVKCDVDGYGALWWAGLVRGEVVVVGVCGESSHGGRREVG